ncbi:hypothetical protein ACIF6L_26450 [Kitasatospora sp. NPDC086009]|uniref:hypothetical protein n=1 Tax=unclassified Kitasatospora TaxID=2633591 RepID=UPI0037C5B89F
MKDSFGVEIEPGDYILSASTTSGRVKVGRAKQGRTGIVMDIELSAVDGMAEIPRQRTGQLGYNTVVLRKADGTAPAHIGPTPDVDAAVRERVVADLQAKAARDWPGIGTLLGLIIGVVRGGVDG